MVKSAQTVDILEGLRVRLMSKISREERVTNLLRDGFLEGDIEFDNAHRREVEAANRFRECASFACAILNCTMDELDEALREYAGMDEWEYKFYVH